jgi:hypothetical protein
MTSINFSAYRATTNCFLTKMVAKASYATLANPLPYCLGSCSKGLPLNISGVKLEEDGWPEGSISKHMQ